MKDRKVKIDGMHLEYLGIAVIAVLMAPIVYLYYRDGIGGAVFSIHDQLDETILNYLFTARYWGQDVYEQMMCGISATSLKPFCYLFVPLYRIAPVSVAFVIQYGIVIATAFFGTYFCVKTLCNSSVGAFFAGTLFALLPVHSVYGNVVMGTPLLILCCMKIREAKGKKIVLPLIGILFYGLSTSFVLVGWLALGFLFCAVILDSVCSKKMSKGLLLGFGVLLAGYLIFNFDLLLGVFGVGSFVSHRTEFALEAESTSFLKEFWFILSDGSYQYEAAGKQELMYVAIGIALVTLCLSKAARKHKKMFETFGLLILAVSVLYAFFAMNFVHKLMRMLPGMLSSLQFTRVYYFLPGLFVILFGLSIAIVIEALSMKSRAAAYICALLVAAPAFLFLLQDNDNIFKQNVAQIVRGDGTSGYVSIKNMYAEDLMEEIDRAIGKDKSTYRVAHIGICPAASLVHGFYTIDGYSNNYSLEYKKQFRTIIADELELNSANKDYFDKWGNRCYINYHEWGNSYMLSRYFHGSIEDLHLNFEEMKKMNCRYLFTAAEITDYEQYGLDFVGSFVTPTSYWAVWVYELNDSEE